MGEHRFEVRYHFFFQIFHRAFFSLGDLHLAYTTLFRFQSSDNATFLFFFTVVTFGYKRSIACVSFVGICSVASPSMGLSSVGELMSTVGGSVDHHDPSAYCAATHAIVSSLACNSSPNHTPSWIQDIISPGIVRVFTSKGPFQIRVTGCQEPN